MASASGNDFVSIPVDPADFNKEGYGFDKSDLQKFHWEQSAENPDIIVLKTVWTGGATTTQVNYVSPQALNRFFDVIQA